MEPARAYGRLDMTGHMSEEEVQKCRQAGKDRIVPRGSSGIVMRSPFHNQYSGRSSLAAGVDSAEPLR